jgi:hypothetical protein
MGVQWHWTAHASVHTCAANVRSPATESTFLVAANVLTMSHHSASRDDGDDTVTAAPPSMTAYTSSTDLHRISISQLTPPKNGNFFQHKIRGALAKQKKGITMRTSGRRAIHTPEQEVHLRRATFLTWDLCGIEARGKARRDSVSRDDCVGEPNHTSSQAVAVVVAGANARSGPHNLDVR